MRRQPASTAPAPPLLATGVVVDVDFARVGAPNAIRGYSSRRLFFLSQRALCTLEARERPAIGGVLERSRFSQEPFQRFAVSVRRLFHRGGVLVRSARSRFRDGAFQPGAVSLSRCLVHEAFHRGGISTRSRLREVFKLGGVSVRSRFSQEPFHRASVSVRSRFIEEAVHPGSVSTRKCFSQEPFHRAGVSVRSRLT